MAIQQNDQTYAVNAGRPWTLREVKFAISSDKSIAEIAKKLGRSYGAVAQVQCKARWARRFAEVL